jgi:phenylalanyl-tRNA synthetase alpha chain
MTALVSLEELETQALDSLAAIDQATALEAWYHHHFSRERGELTLLMRRIPQVEPSERKAFGQAVNRLKVRLEEAHAARQAELRSAALSAQLEAERLDVTLPGRVLPRGRRHPLSATLERIVDVFHGLGFDLAEGPEVEDDWHNFTALNTPADHPARDMQDTFYLPDGHLLRTHTSSVQIRLMESTRPPIRALMPGRVYRRDAVTSRHYPIFHQVEGLVVEPGITMGHLKGTLTVAMQALFGRDRAVRFRPSYFPFTEPSAEYDVQCICGGEGCRICSYTGWLEVGGCGMVDPSVFEAVGLDPSEVQGFAFGLGAERIAMLVHGIPDIRLLWENHERFLEQF